MCAPFLALTTVVWLAGHPQPPERSEAERLARIGRHAEALAAFQRIAARDPADVESRVWIGRLQLWMGRAPEAESTFRAVLLEHPKDVDARIGLGTALLRSNRTDEAIAVLEATGVDAGANPDVFAALARANRQAGRPRAARDLFVEAHRLAPDDPDILDGLEAVRRTYDHFVGLEGYAETMPEDGGNSADGTLTLSLRTSERLRLDGVARLQDRSGGTDSLFGGRCPVARGQGHDRLGDRARRSGQPEPAGPLDIDGADAVLRLLGARRRPPSAPFRDDRRDGAVRDRRRGTPAAAGAWTRDTRTHDRHSRRRGAPQATIRSCCAACAGSGGASGSPAPTRTGPRASTC